MIKEVRLKVIDQIEIAKDTIEVRFARGDFEYTAGQYITIRLDEEIGDGRGNSRAFSLSSSPTNKNYISTCFRLPDSPSEFKQKLVSYRWGTEVNIRGPLGNFTLPESTEKPIVMIAGGVGIVPFMSMIKYSTEISSGHKIILCYTDKSTEKMAYREELLEFEKKNPNFKFCQRFCRVDEECLKNEYGLLNSFFMICVTSGMVEHVS